MTGLRFALVVAALSATSATAAGREIVQKREIPAAVAGQVQCGTEPETISRWPFAGGYLFAWQCASNHANNIVAYVYARSPDGDGAKLIRFPAPERDNEPLEEISNARITEASITHLFIDPEDQEVCRTEARWSLANGVLQPELVFWRETGDCDGKRGWRVRVNKGR